MSSSDYQKAEKGCMVLMMVKETTEYVVGGTCCNQC